MLEHYGTFVQLKFPFATIYTREYVVKLFPHMSNTKIMQTKCYKHPETFFHLSFIMIYPTVCYVLLFELPVHNQQFEQSWMAVVNLEPIKCYQSLAVACGIQFDLF